MKAVKKSIVINASREKIWDVLTKDHHTREWFTVFGEGLHAQTDWSPGSKVIFSDKSKNGMIAKVKENVPGELLSVEFTGMYSGGKEDYDSEHAKSIKGGHETYRLEKDHDALLLKISSDTNEDSYDGMSEAWDNAMNKVKELAETA